jgi:hypothetical protein
LQQVFRRSSKRRGENDQANSGKIPVVKTASWDDLWVTMHFRCVELCSPERTQEELGTWANAT